MSAAFNLSLLARIKREPGGDFQLRRFRHRAFYDEDRGWIEMHIESLASQFVHVGGERFSFSQGETIRTGVSCKHSIDECRALAQRAGFAPGQTWTDAAKLFSVHGMIAVQPRPWRYNSGEGSNTENPLQNEFCNGPI